MCGGAEKPFWSSMSSALSAGAVQATAKYEPASVKDADIVPQGNIPEEKKGVPAYNVKGQKEIDDYSGRLFSLVSGKTEPFHPIYVGSPQRECIMRGPDAQNQDAQSYFDKHDTPPELGAEIRKQTLFMSADKGDNWYLPSTFDEADIQKLKGMMWNFVDTLKAAKPFKQAKVRMFEVMKIVDDSEKEPAGDSKNTESEGPEKDDENRPYLIDRVYNAAASQ